MLSPIPSIRRSGDRLVIDTAAGEVEVVPNHNDRKRVRWWRLEQNGKPLSPYMSTPALAAMWARR